MKYIQHPTSFVTGLLLVSVACFALFLSHRLSNFTDIGLGPGFAPRMLAVLQILLAVPLIVRAFFREGEALERFHLRPQLVIIAIAYFAVTIERMGLVVALTGLVLISCAANSETKLREAVLLALGVVVFSYVLFIKALGLLIPIWPAIG